jgi:hypothetical protein
MALLGISVAMLAAFVLLLRLGLPRSDGTSRGIAANEHLASAYAVLLVALVIGGIALAFATLK